LKRQVVDEEVIKVVVAPLAGDEGRMSLKPLKHGEGKILFYHLITLLSRVLRILT